MLNQQTALNVFNRGSVIVYRYSKEVTLPHVRLFVSAIGVDYVFMNDNARPHQTPAAVHELLKSEDIIEMDWSSYSPDLNPIEHMWNAFGKRIVARLYPPENTLQLKQMLIKDLPILPLELMDNLVLSMD